jgi:hypothetical protein
MPDFPIAGWPVNSVVTTLSPWCVGVELAAVAAAAPASTAWPSANRAILTPMRLPEIVTVTKLYWYNGATVSGNVDCGIYTADGRLVVSTGSTAQAGTSAGQEVNITDTQIGPGIYYLALALSSATGTIFRTAPTLAFLKAMGLLQIASAVPLPASATLAAMATAYVPVVGAVIAPRTLAA